VIENYNTLTLDDTTPFFYETVINDHSSLISVSGGSVVAADPFQFPSGTDGLNFVLAGGDDGASPTDPQWVGEDLGPGNRTGLQAMIDRDGVSIVAIPGITSQVVQNAIITHCETLLDRFSILDPVYAGQPLDEIQAQRSQFDTKYAALYFPNLRANDPLTNTEIVLPPSGHIAGIYARTDIERGVHKAPANAVVNGITGLDLNITKGEQDVLNPANINVIRDFRLSNRGFRVWGARCSTSDSLWRYVPVRRLFIFVEESLGEGLEWVVFEPNAEPLWARVVQSISSFLIRVWRDGALMGVKPEEAFFVRCDRTTMTQDDIDNGRLIILVGIAPVKPAEFVIVRIQQYTAEANVAA
jgi:phage tail sheath protein FI